MLCSKTIRIVVLTLGLGASNAHAQDTARPVAQNHISTPLADSSDSHIVDSKSQQPERSTNFELGLRIGYGIPMGSISDYEFGTEKLSDTFSGQVPIGIDIGYKITQKITLGLYGQYAFGLVGGKFGNVCERGSSLGVTCSASDLRIGVQGQYHFLPMETVNPWVGLGVGYEWLRFGFNSPDSVGTVTAKGIEFAAFQAGLDYQLTSKLGIGPFASFSMGQFSSKSTSGGTDGLPGAGDIAKKTMHEWLTFGVRGTYNL